MRAMKQSARAPAGLFCDASFATQESERQRIAAELHDSLGQRLVTIRNLRGDPRDARKLLSIFSGDRRMTWNVAHSMPITFSFDSFFFVQMLSLPCGRLSASVGKAKRRIL